MAKVIETFENAKLISVEHLTETPLYEWDWRCMFTGYKGTLYIGESQHKNPRKRFIMLTNNKDFQLTTGYGKIEQAYEHIKITTKNSVYIFEID